MSNTIYVTVNELNKTQIETMKVVDRWVHKKKIPVPLEKIILKMMRNGVDENSTIYSLKILVRKGYIRRAYTHTNKTYFVQLKGI